MNNLEVNDKLSFKDKEKHGLHGHVKIMIENTDTKETALWYENDNIIPISGMQFVLMKMFGLYLDSVHDPSISYEDIGKDTNLVIPDLNYDSQLNIGTDPSNYTVMEDDISANHFIQGFMIGNGGSGEDGITSKNTDYAFTKLRNPIPFQQADQGGLNSTIAGKYLGNYRQSNALGNNYYIKKFDERPHVYHGWYHENQEWDFIDPVSQSDLGPNSQSAPKSNRIETYAEVEMSVDARNNDCIGYFNNLGGNQAALINELGLVAFDTIPGERSLLQTLYERKIKRFIVLVFDDNRSATADDEVIALARDIAIGLTGITQTNIKALHDLCQTIAASTSLDYETYQTELSSNTNIEVEAFYNQNHIYTYETDKYLEYLALIPNLTVDEANRIKLVTYYTFNSIALKRNQKIIINYRIYAN